MRCMICDGRVPHDRMCGIVFTLQSADATDDDGADFDALVRGVAPRGLLIIGLSRTA